jgi:hypothetical protein
MADAAQAEKGRKLMMTGAVLVMGACMVGGLGGIIMAAGVAIVFGAWLQVKGYGLHKKANQK